MKRNIPMREKSFTSFIILTIVCLLISCAELRFIPEGSQSMGVYEGSFDGNVYDGDLRFHLFQAPEGDKLFEANFVRNTQDPTVGRDFFVRGKMEASSLKGEMQGEFNGTLNGKISSDGNRLTGSYNITTPDVDKGTWQAQKK